VRASVKTRASKVIAFCETLPVPDGKLAGSKVRLRVWQKRLIRRAYKPGKGGLRKVKQAVLSMPRKNGKTALIACLVLCHLCGPEAIRNGQLYSIAFDREQAAIVFRYVSAMIYMDPELSARLSVHETGKRITDPVSGSIYTALSRESRSKHGKSTSFLICDELGQFGSNRELYDTMMTSTGAHDDSMCWVISTQARDDSAVLSELIDYGLRVESADITDDTFILDLYVAPSEADIWSEKVWHKCNPALGDFRSMDEMRNYAFKAKRIPSMENSFRNLYLNQRIEANETFIRKVQWDKCSGSIALAGPCYAGLDLSGKNDLSALVLVSDVEHLCAVSCFFWKPGDAIAAHEERDRAPYRTWVKQGHIEARDGPVIDYGYIARRIAELIKSPGIIALAFDRWRIDDMRRELDEIGIATWIHGKDDPSEELLCLIPHGQGFKDMSPAVEVLEDAVSSAALRHGDNPVLNMCAANATVTTDPAGGRKFDKRRQYQRIDGIVALAMALNAKDRLSESVRICPSPYEDRGIRSL